MSVRDWIRLARPPNLVLGVLGVVSGGLAAHGLDIAWWPLSLAAFSTLLGIASANAFNDALDASVDATAHPDRPVAQGRLSPRQASGGAAAGFTFALAAAWMANLAAGLVATLLVLLLVGYEAFLKRRGLVGNIAVSLAVAATFVLGAVAGMVGPFAWEVGAMQATARTMAWDVVAALAVMAFLANVAREVYKDIQDVEADRGRRRSLPMVVGDKAARWVAGVILVPACLFAVSLFYTHSSFGDVYLLLVLPAVIAFVLSIAAADAQVSVRAVKVGMVFALFAFWSVGLL